jgi:hypothetical protein
MATLSWSGHQPTSSDDFGRFSMRLFGSRSDCDDTTTFPMHYQSRTGYVRTPERIAFKPEVTAFRVLHDLACTFLPIGSGRWRARMSSSSFFYFLSTFHLYLPSFYCGQTIVSCRCSHSLEFLAFWRTIVCLSFVSDWRPIRFPEIISRYCFLVHLYQYCSLLTYSGLSNKVCHFSHCKKCWLTLINMKYVVNIVQLEWISMNLSYHHKPGR